MILIFFHCIFIQITNVRGPIIFWQSRYQKLSSANFLHFISTLFHFILFSVALKGWEGKKFLKYFYYLSNVKNTDWINPGTKWTAVKWNRKNIFPVYVKEIRWWQSPLVPSVLRSVQLYLCSKSELLLFLLYYRLSTVHIYYGGKIRHYLWDWDQERNVLMDGVGKGWIGLNSVSSSKF